MTKNTKIIREEKTSESLPKEVIQNLSNEQREKMVNNFIDQSAKDYELELEVMRVAKDLAKDRNNKVFILLIIAIIAFIAIIVMCLIFGNPSIISEILKVFVSFLGGMGVGRALGIFKKEY
ncbi:MAG: hypothetical protein KBF12_00345 [Sebaldella sp.]|nr:hypothetical protein [Sebaldella sp.]